MTKFIDLTGQRFGKLVVIQQLPRERDENGKLLRRKWLCQCDCGNTCETDGANLRGGKSSCGCAMSDLQRKRHEAMMKARAEIERRKKEGIVVEKPPRCPYPDGGCKISRKGVCCWDCEEYEGCERVCKNNPSKCGVQWHE